jgi:RNA polymerase sigma-70 factor (ECF subfamily)
MQRRSTWSEPRLVAAVDLADPSSDLERREELELAIRVLLEKLPPAERAAYLLREALDYRYRELGAVLGVTEANARQIVTRARRRLAAGDRAAADRQ